MGYICVHINFTVRTGTLRIEIRNTLMRYFGSPFISLVDKKEENKERGEQ